MPLTVTISNIFSNKIRTVGEKQLRRSTALISRRKNMTFGEMLDIAIIQSAIDSGCEASDFKSGKNKTVISKQNDKARKYLTLPFVADITTYGNGVVASVSEDFYDITDRYINSYTPYHLFETPNMHVFSSELRKKGADICFMAEYWLAKGEAMPKCECDYELRVMYPDTFKDLYLPEWSNALCKERSHLDKITVGAFDKGRLIALSGASSDCEDMWQIGIDVLPEYRRKGIACALTVRLAKEIMYAGKVPFYCCAWSNIASARNAVRSGFVPAWVQMTAKITDFIDNANKEQLLV